MTPFRGFITILFSSPSARLAPVCCRNFSTGSRFKRHPRLFDIICRLTAVLFCMLRYQADLQASHSWLETDGLGWNRHRLFCFRKCSPILWICLVMQSNCSTRSTIRLAGPVVSISGSLEGLNLPSLWASCWFILAWLSFTFLKMIFWPLQFLHNW